MHKEVRDQLALKRKMVVLEYAGVCRYSTEAYRESEVPKSTFYRWRKAYAEGGRPGLVRKKPIDWSLPDNRSRCENAYHSC